MQHVFAANDVYYTSSGGTDTFSAESTTPVLRQTCQSQVISGDRKETLWQKNK